MERWQDCECLCHRAGQVIHVVPCCERTYEFKFQAAEPGSSFTQLHIPPAEAIKRERKTKMPNEFDWDNAEEIGIQLAEKHPNVDPLTVRFTDLHKWIIELPGFTGDPKLSNEGKLEAIQMAWHEEFQDNKS
jgi:FeS assembly protein IscX